MTSPGPTSTPPQLLSWALTHSHGSPPDQDALASWSTRTERPRCSTPMPSPSSLMKTRGRRAPSRERVFAAPKVPEVFLLFWIVKLLTTGIGEAGSDFLGTINIPFAAVVGIGGFFLALRVQLRDSRY